MLVGWDSKAKRYWSYLIPAKGTDYEGFEVVVANIVKDLRRTGYKRVNLRTDGEAGLLSLMNSVMISWEGESVPQVSAPGDWKSHGPVENAVKFMKGHVRTVLDDLQCRLKVKLDPEHPLLTWIVQYVSTTYFRYALGSDGMTPERRSTGRSSNQPSAEFGERVWWKPQ